MSKLINTNLDFNSAARILNLPDGASAQEPATVAQLNAAIEGLAWKDSCRVATQANLNLASPGATIDGITMATNDRVLVRSQTTGSENGIYIWNGSAVAMTRSADASTAAELEQAVVTVEEGTSDGATFRQTVVNFTLGSGTVTWSAFGTSAPSASETTAGIAEIATQAETDAGTDDLRFVTPLKLATYAGKAKRYAATIGDGSATSITVTHNLGSTDPHVQVWETGGSKRMVDCEVQVSSSNAVVLLFASAPAASAYRVVVLA